MKKNVIWAWVQSHQQKKETVSSALKRFLKETEFFKIIVENPRDNKQAYRNILKAFKSEKLMNDWMTRYQKLYTNYVSKLLGKAQKVEDVVKIMPNFSPWTLEQKFGSIKIGGVPETFRSENDFLSFMRKVHQAKAVKNFKNIKKLECHMAAFQKAFPAVKKIDWFNFSERSQFLRDLMKKNCGKPFTINHLEKRYKVTFLANPFSRKMVFDVQASDKNRYIIKASPYNFLNVSNDRVRKEHESMAIAGDSTYADAMIEFYLKLNKCVNAPKILYYHHSQEVAIYEPEEGHPFHSGTRTKKYLDFYSFNTKIVKDAVRLGVYVNDINPGNFVVSKQDGEVKIIDIGHASFANPLTPGVPGLTYTLGNLCGQDYLSIHGVLSVEDV